MSLFELRSEIPPETVDEVDNLLQERGVEGWSLLQDVIQQRAWIIGIFASEAEASAKWKDLRPSLVTAAEPKGRELADEDWKHSYKAHFHPSRFGRLHWVPIWLRESYPLPPRSAVIWLDPGLAFGTGNHETTQLCCERLVAFAEKRGGPEIFRKARVVDAGCGSGILALSAAKLGFQRVEGFDNDAEAVRVSVENAALNDLKTAVTFITADLQQGLAGDPITLLLANIQADVLMNHAALFISALALGGELVLSGILAIELEKVKTVFAAAAPGWWIDSRTRGEWSDLQLVHPGVSGC